MKKINHNGQLVAENSLDLNRGYRYGDGLFETLRGTEGTVPLWRHHMERLLTGMRALGYKINALPGGAETFFANQVQMVLPPHGTHRVRLLVHRAGGGTYAPTDNGFEWTVRTDALVPTPDPLPPLRVGCYRAIRLVPSPVSRFKTTSALRYVQAARYARLHQLDDVLLFNSSDRPVEGSAYGLVIRRANTLLAPPHAEGGVWSTYVSFLEHGGAARLGYRLRYQRLTLADLHAADAIYFVNAVRGMRRVNLVGGAAG